ncbi:IclR family transcriptional regulator [Halobellus ruber]|uniref:IclR family transcriptional regulator n=1 Tax=Halobellus ruber TaxID=2761102 RepID=A0A7J9SLS3_9EURY|nr:IclR family transcriptional regulator [Halobellus ruber]MBB6647658.1 IclR family transcriptional regulator [Halobellus ruber]
MKSTRSEQEHPSTLLDIISVLDREGPMGVTEVAGTLDIAKSTAHYHLSTLRQNGFVTKDGTRYGLGLSFLKMGLETRRREPLFDAAKEEIDKLADETGELAILSVEQRGLGVYLYKRGGSNALDIDAPIGGSASLHNRALGKAMLSRYDEERVDDIIDRHGLPETAERTITSRAELKDALRNVREEGVAFNREESIDGIHGVGVPITTAEGNVLGAISVAGPAKRLNGSLFNEDLPDILSRARNVIELNHQHGHTY